MMTDEVTRSAANHALLNYRQADNEGIMVEVSRQAIHMVDDEIKQLRAERDALKAKLEEAQEVIKPFAGEKSFIGDVWPAILSTLGLNASDFRRVRSFYDSLEIGK